MSSTKARNQLLEELGTAGRDNSRMSIMFRQAVADRVALHATDMECVDFLLEAGSASAGDLAKMTGLSSGAMTAAIDRLEKAGLVKRMSDALDRRKVIIKPVPRRLHELEKIYRGFVRSVMASLEDFSEAELATITRHYQRLTAVYRDQIKQLQTRKPR